MQNFNAYVVGVVYTAAAAALIMAATPKGWPKTLIGVLSGLALILAICRPPGGADWGGLAARGGLATPVSPGGTAGLAGVSPDAAFERYQEEQDKLLKELIAEKTSAYILSKAQAMGVQCLYLAEVTLGGDPPRPEGVRITGETKPPGDVMERLAAMLEQDCGIPPERQRFDWKGEES